MGDVFISHANQDSDVALALAERLRSGGYSTWCYEEDSAAGFSYLVQIDRAIEAAQAVVVIVSAASLHSGQVLKEIVRAHESAKPFIPVRRGLSHEEFQAYKDDDRRREWRMALGAAVSVPVDPLEVSGAAVQVVRGLAALGVRHRVPQTAGSPTGHAGPRPMVDSPRPYRLRAEPHRVLDTDNALRGVRRVGAILARPVPRLVIAALVGGFGILAGLQSLLGVLAPGSRPDQELVYRLFPLLRLLNLLTNLAGLGLNGLLLRAVWRVIAREPGADDEVVRVVRRLMALVAVWCVLAVVVTVGADGWRTLGRGQGALLGGLFGVTVFGLAQLALVHALFRHRPTAAGASERDAHA